MAKKQPKKALAPPTIHSATLGRMGEVVKGSPLSLTTAVAERRAGQDVVVCGASVVANLQIAQQIEGQATGGQFVSTPHIAAQGLTRYRTFSREPAGQPGILSWSRRLSASPGET